MSVHVGTHACEKSAYLKPALVIVPLILVAHIGISVRAYNFTNLKEILFQPMKYYRKLNRSFHLGISITIKYVMYNHVIPLKSAKEELIGLFCDLTRYCCGEDNNN